MTISDDDRRLVTANIQGWLLEGEALVVKDDERALWLRMLETKKFPRNIGKELGIHHKRIKRICEKWEDKGVYEYGVSVDLGWPVA